MADILAGVWILTVIGTVGALSVTGLVIADLSRGTPSFAPGGTADPSRSPRPPRLTLTRLLLLFAALFVLARALCMFLSSIGIGSLLIAYIGNLFEFGSKILVYITLIVAKRQFFRLESLSARKISLLFDFALITGLISLGLSTFGIGVAFKLRNEYDTWLQHSGFGPVGVIVAVTFLSWIALCTIFISAILLRKIVHARRAGLREDEAKILKEFTVVVIPVLLFSTVTFLISLFLGLLADDNVPTISSQSAIAIVILSLVGSMIGDVVLLEQTRRAMNKVNKLPI